MIPQDRFTRQAQEAMVRTQAVAQEFGHSTVEPEHLLVALLEQTNGPVAEALLALDADPGALAAGTRAAPEPACPGKGRPSSSIWAPAGGG